MTKPIVFLSHSSFDEKPLKILKDLLFKKTGGAITLFLSSDGQSIPLGRNWVHELQEALDNSQLMFVFISPNSLRSSWIHFEVGYAYSKKIKVIPVAINGLDLGQVAPPLSLLQGFNINSNAGLNNLIAVINQEFDHVHEESFLKNDFEAIFAESDSDNELGFSPKLAKVIEKVSISIGTNKRNSIDIIEKSLKDKKVEFTRAEDKITAYGMDISFSNYQEEYFVRVDISIELFKLLLPAISEFISEILGGLDAEVETDIEFVPEVSMRNGPHNVSARLYGTKVELSAGEFFQYKNIKFKTDYREDYSNEDYFSEGKSQGNVYMRIVSTIKQLQEVDVEDLLNILFEKEVLMISGES